MIPKDRKGVFVVVYAKTNGEIEYLLLKRKLHWKGWEFPKGGIDDKEHIYSAIKRELKEETGLNALRMTKFPVHGKYDYRRIFADRYGIIGQTYTLFSAEVRKRTNIGIDKQEHSGHKWMRFEEALKLLTWKNQRQCLRAVHTSLIKGKMKYREIEINGKTALLGKNQEQNESLVNEFIGKDNLIMHTVAPGSPFGVALEEFNGEEKKQLANWVAAYSQDWRDNHSNVRVHMFTGKRVYKDKNMSVGTFGVKKTRTITSKKRDIEKCKKQ